MVTFNRLSVVCLQVFHCHFNSNFFPLFLESLLGDDVPQLVCSLILGKTDAKTATFTFSQPLGHL